MNQTKFVRKFALSFPEVTEEPHFEKISFRIKKKIFATYDEIEKLLCLKLSEIDQNVFSTIDTSLIFPVPNKWGKQGWTLFKIEKINKDVLIDALTTAYCEAAPKKLTEQVKPKSNNL